MQINSLISKSTDLWNRLLYWEEPFPNVTVSVFSDPFACLVFKKCFHYLQSNIFWSYVTGMCCSSVMRNLGRSLWWLVAFSQTLKLDWCDWNVEFHLVKLLHHRHILFWFRGWPRRLLESFALNRSESLYCPAWVSTEQVSFLCFLKKILGEKKKNSRSFLIWH